MSNISKYKNGWMLLLFILIGIVIGGLVSQLTEGISFLSWLSYGQTFGINNGDNPLIIDLGLLVLSFSVRIKITIASIIFVILSIVLYKFI